MSFSEKCMFHPLQRQITSRPRTHSVALQWNCIDGLLALCSAVWRGDDSSIPTATSAAGSARFWRSKPVISASAARSKTQYEKYLSLLIFCLSMHAEALQKLLTLRSVRLHVCRSGKKSRPSCMFAQEVSASKLRRQACAHTWKNKQKFIYGFAAFRNLARKCRYTQASVTSISVCCPIQGEPDVLAITLQRQCVSRGGPRWGQTSARAVLDYKRPPRFGPDQPMDRTW